MSRIQKALAADLGITIRADGEAPWPPGTVLDWDAVYAGREPGSVRWA